MFGKIAIFVALQACTVSSAGLTKNYVTSKLVPAIKLLFQNNTIRDTTPGAVLRLTFHDCAGSGGCDGCLNTSLPDNAGLDGPVKVLERLYANLSLSTVMSRADLWALAGIVAANDGMKKGYPMRYPVPPLIDPANFKFGRKDCATAPNSTTDQGSDFPSPFLGSSAVTSYFATRFGFNGQQTVAIMGAHHLGKMHQEYSGFNGAWVPGQTLNGTYYKQLVNVSANWHQRTANCSEWINPMEQKIQWVDNRGTPCLNMLNVDMALYKNIGISQFNGAVACTYSTCPPAPTASWVTRYANNATDFQYAFAAVYDIMLSVCGHAANGAPSMCNLTRVA